MWIVTDTGRREAIDLAKAWRLSVEDDDADLWTVVAHFPHGVARVVAVFNSESEAVALMQHYAARLYDAKSGGY